MKIIREQNPNEKIEEVATVTTIITETYIPTKAQEWIISPHTLLTTDWQ